MAMGKEKEKKEEVKEDEEEEVPHRQSTTTTKIRAAGPRIGSTDAPSRGQHYPWVAAHTLTHTHTHTHTHNTHTPEILSC